LHAFAVEDSLAIVGALFPYAAKIRVGIESVNNAAYIVQVSLGTPSEIGSSLSEYSHEFDEVVMIRLLLLLLCFFERLIILHR
jgi:hypothetical protein